MTGQPPLQYYTLVAKNNANEVHRAGRFLARSADEAISKARGNFDAAPILKRLRESPGFRFEVAEVEPFHG